MKKFYILLLSILFTTYNSFGQCDDSSPETYQVLLAVSTPDVDLTADPTGSGNYIDFQFSAVSGFATSDIDVIAYAYDIDNDNSVLGSGTGYITGATSFNLPYQVPNCTGNILISGFILLEDGVKIIFSSGTFGLCEGGNDTEIFSYVFNCDDQDYCGNVTPSPNYSFLTSPYSSDNGGTFSISVDAVAGFTNADISYVLLDYSFDNYTEQGTAAIFSPSTTTDDILSPVLLDENGECTMTNGDVIFSGALVMVDGTKLAFSDSSVPLCSGGNEEYLYTVSAVEAGQTDCSFLPIELSFFAANRVHSDVHLSWETFSEYENKGFEIQRRTDITSWESIDFVEGRGNSFTAMHYRLKDLKPGNKNLYYRLKQKDFDGQFTFSNVAIVPANESIENQEIAFPNPFQSAVTINKLNRGSILRLKTISGQFILESIVNSPTETFDLNTLSRGIYLLEIQNGTEVKVLKLIKD